MLFNSDTMLIDWVENFELCMTWDFVHVKRYIQDKKVCRATKKNIETFVNEMTQEVLNYLRVNHSVNEHFGIEYEYILRIVDSKITIITKESPINRGSILLAK